MSTGQTSSKPKVALIAGPTASGKTVLAVRLAQRLGDAGKRAVVINADSAQIYADLAVLSARPTTDEMGGIEHRLFGTWDGATACSAAGWTAAAKREIAALHSENAVPVLVGGSGLYLRTLFDGIAPVPPIDPAIRAMVRELPQAEARRMLETEDPAAATRLAPADAARTARALEVVRSTGEPLASWQAQRCGGICQTVTVHAAVLLPERDRLYERCDRRFEAMIDGGALTEVELLVARALDPALPIMRAIGVREVASLLQGKLSRAEALLAGQITTRRYAKRQYTWFRHQPRQAWQKVESENYYNRAIDELLFHFLH